MFRGPDGGGGFRFSDKVLRVPQTRQGEQVEPTEEVADELRGVNLELEKITRASKEINCPEFDEAMVAWRNASSKRVWEHRDTDAAAKESAAGTLTNGIEELVKELERSAPEKTELKKVIQSFVKNFLEPLQNTYGQKTEKPAS